MSHYDGLFTFYYRVCEGVINFDCIKNQSIKSVTENAFNKYKEYIKTNWSSFSQPLWSDKSKIITGSNVYTRDCAFHRVEHDLNLYKMNAKKDSTIRFSDI